MTELEQLTKEIVDAEYILNNSFSSESWLRNLYNQLLEKRARILKGQI